MPLFWIFKTLTPSLGKGWKHKVLFYVCSGWKLSLLNLLQLSVGCVAVCISLLTVGERIQTKYWILLRLDGELWANAGVGYLFLEMK